MHSKRVATAIDDLAQKQRKRTFYTGVRAFFARDLTRADAERRFGVRPVAAARDVSTYRCLATQKLFYGAGQRYYATTERNVHCESASDLFKPEIETLATLTRAVAGRTRAKISYLSLTAGVSTKTLRPLALADTGVRWNLRACDHVRGRSSRFALTRIIKAKAINRPNPLEEQIESDVQWAPIVHIELVPHSGIAHPKAIEAYFRINNRVLALDMRAPLVGYALRQWSVDCSTKHILDPKEHHLWLKNSQTLYGVESATLAPGYSSSENIKIVE